MLLSEVMFRPFLAFLDWVFEGFCFFEKQIQVLFFFCFLKFFFGVFWGVFVFVVVFFWSVFWCFWGFNECVTTRWTDSLWGVTGTS